MQNNTANYETSPSLKVTVNFKYADCAMISKKSKRTALQDTWKRRKLPKADCKKVTSSKQTKTSRVYADNLLQHQYYVRQWAIFTADNTGFSSLAHCALLCVKGTVFKRCVFHRWSSRKFKLVCGVTKAKALEQVHADWTHTAQVPN